MALARCNACGAPRGKGGNIYSGKPRNPIGLESAIVCGTENCLNAGRIYLTAKEESKYEQGVRIFEITGGHRATKFKIQ